MAHLEEDWVSDDLARIPEVADRTHFGDRMEELGERETPGSTSAVDYGLSGRGHLGRGGSVR